MVKVKATGGKLNVARTIRERMGNPGIQVNNYVCDMPKCSRSPYYNVAGSSRALYCAIHKSASMVDIFADWKTCRYQSNYRRTPCTHQATYSFDPIMQPTHCHAHRALVMHQVVAARCEGQGKGITVCAYEPIFKNPGDLLPTICAMCDHDGRVDYREDKWHIEGCMLRPRFNFPGTKMPIVCPAHCEQGMVNMRDKTCSVINCTTRPAYSWPGEKSGRFCVQHRSPEMMNVIDKVCEHPGCTTRPAYNYPLNRGGVFCSKHKKTGMVNVKSKLCLFPGCCVIPSYNHVGLRGGRFCVRHKDPGMIDVRTTNSRCKAKTRQPKKYNKSSLPIIIKAEPSLTSTVAVKAVFTRDVLSL